MQLTESNVSRNPPLSINSNKAIKVPGLDGSGKMGKSEGNAIYLIDDEKTIKKKVMKAVTDAGPTEPNSVKPEPIANLFTMMEIVSTKDTFDFFNEKYNNCEIRYGDLKKQLAEDINNFCAPIRERILDIRSNEDYLAKVARMGAEKASESAAKTLREVREIIGFKRISIFRLTIFEGTDYTDLTVELKPCSLCSPCFVYVCKAGDFVRYNLLKS